MLSQHATSAEIARLVGKHRSTIDREIRRNTNGADIYYEKHAHARMLRRRKDAKAPFRIIENDLGMQDYIENFLKWHFSPEQVVGWMRRSEFSRSVCQRTNASGRNAKHFYASKGVRVSHMVGAR